MFYIWKDIKKNELKVLPFRNHQVHTVIKDYQIRNYKSY